MKLVNDCPEFSKGRCNKKGVLCGLNRKSSLDLCKETKTKKTETVKKKSGPKSKK